MPTALYHALYGVLHVSEDRWLNKNGRNLVVAAHHLLHAWNILNDIASHDADQAYDPQFSQLIRDAHERCSRNESFAIEPLVTRIYTSLYCALSTF